MKTDKKAKNAYKKLKNSIKVIGKLPEKVKKWPTGEFELFKKIAEQRAIEIDWVKWVMAKHIATVIVMAGMDNETPYCYKFIPMNKLTPWNFDHKIPKSRGKEYRLDPENIEIVSVAWHFWKTNWQILKIDYPN